MTFKVPRIEFKEDNWWSVLNVVYDKQHCSNEGLNYFLSYDYGYSWGGDIMIDNVPPSKLQLMKDLSADMRIWINQVDQNTQ